MRKSTQITVAYIALSVAAIGCIFQDAQARSGFSKAMTEAEKMAASRSKSSEVKPRAIQTSQPNVRTVSEPEVSRTSSMTPRSSSNPAPELPRGVYLVKEALMAQSTDGTMCELKAGTPVSLMRWEDGKMKVSFEGRDFLVDEKLLTRNSKSVSRLLTRKS
jgi:hypothetical protein